MYTTGGNTFVYYSPSFFMTTTNLHLIWTKTVHSSLIKWRLVQAQPSWREVSHHRDLRFGSPSLTFSACMLLFSDGFPSPENPEPASKFSQNSFWTWVQQSLTKVLDQQFYDEVVWIQNDGVDSLHLEGFCQSEPTNYP